MKILLANDDGIYAPGLAAMEKALRAIGDVTVIAPATEQSGVGHSITFLSPLVCKEIYDGDRKRGYAVEGSPADCVKLGVVELMDERPDLIVSGINGGLNAGINVLYSGTVGAAIEGAFFGITSIAVSLEWDEHAQFDRAAEMARQIISQILEHKSKSPRLYNLNIPTPATKLPPGEAELKIVPMGVARYGEHFIKRKDPRNRDYYWATGDPRPEHGEEETDLSALEKGYLTLTPLHFDMTERAQIDEMKPWNLKVLD
ncbi:5'/3'-nucleotidase SurE [Blastopirellula marina]|uniref:5'-nucleotidase SurE n=1 Tax=Blastopirellula marina TaxID=124 RepID=A0A2S8F1M6_9BACT|nr:MULTISPECIES: 5'/3'-nucleotidase SurE [Pirellulaceae]PQO26078.1 5'/3'-nucleotidase SurE [Blastopirellula marina]RCS44436.1 5'/3'-nucleotidase SurE [Bremerella cremea]